jgi:hypothetical protein
MKRKLIGILAGVLLVANSISMILVLHDQKECRERVTYLENAVQYIAAGSDHNDQILLAEILRLQEEVKTLIGERRI